MKKPRIVIFNDTHGWHSQQLMAELKQLGIDVILTDLALCTIDLTQKTGLSIPGFDDDTLPAAAMVRGISPGSLEKITLRMDILHTLDELGVPVFNSAKAIEHTVDKARTSLRLHLAGVSTPKTWACESIDIAREIAYPQFASGKVLVVKPLFGCQGKGIERIDSLVELEALAPVGEAFYLQEYIVSNQQGEWQDWRLLVIDGEVKAGMSRRSQHWITNFARGADCLATTITGDMEQLAINATKAVGADYAGVDLIRHNDGQYTILEVNSVPAWKGLQQATNIKIAAHIAQAINRRIEAQQVNSLKPNHAH